MVQTMVLEEYFFSSPGTYTLRDNNIYKTMVTPSNGTSGGWFRRGPQHLVSEIASPQNTL
jgi:hypothetical protein